MSKANKNKKNKVPKINEEEYAAYIAHLKEGVETPTQPAKERENQLFLGMENKTE